MRPTALATLILMMFLILATACAPGPNPSEKTPNGQGKVAGFWLGLWQGLISPITFVISVFSDKVRLYEVHNNGRWYNFGFVLGAGLFLSGGVLGKRRSR